MTTVGGADDVRRRPKDRKKQIALNATALFVERGFHSVRMDDIAATTGITVRALYRHYKNKQDLLWHVVHDGQTTYFHALQESGISTTTAAPDPQPLERAFPELAIAALDIREFAMLWQREARYLTPDQLAPIRTRLTNLAAQLTTRVHQTLPHLSTAAAEVRAWALLAVLVSPGHHQLTLPRQDFEKLLASACSAVLAAPSVSPLNIRTKTPGDVSAMTARREQLLAAAAHEFRYKGYPAVSIDDISAQLNIAGPALYHYFPTKLDLLVALSRRAEEWLMLETKRAIRGSSSPEDTLHRIVAGQVRVAVEDPDLIATSVTETPHLPHDVAESITRSRNDRELEWNRCISPAWRGTPDPKTRILVAAATGLINDIIRTPHLLNMNGVGEEITSIATTILTTTI